MADGTRFSIQLSKANAEHLAMCWNTHDELVAALRLIAFRVMGENGFGTGGTAEELQQIARAALAKI